MFCHPYGQCAQCGARIVEYDDDAHVCIDCGGRNRKLHPPPRDAMPGATAMAVAVLLLILLALAGR